MLLLKYVCVILHVITAAAWFGLGLPLARRARATADVEPVAAAALAADGGRTVRLMSVFAILTLVFSLAAFFLGGGFGAYGPQYHTSLLLILAFVGVQLFLIGRGWSGLQAAVAAGGDAEAARKKVAMGVGIGHTLWLALLVLMFWNQLRAGFLAL
ncbi:MAG: hypothetical protein R3362_03055 [Rhodothermales bacterium]|nr:hypothetical protein [Rhodothermales bacterium]